MYSTPAKVEDVKLGDLDGNSLTKSEEELQHVLLHHPLLQDYECYSHDMHYRYNFHPDHIRGSGEICMLSRGMLMYLIDAEFCSAYSMNILAPDVLRIRIATEGDTSYRVPNGNNVSFAGANVSIIVEPEGMAPARADLANHHRTVQLYVSRNTLQAVYGGGEDDLPDAIREFLTGDLKQTFIGQIPLQGALYKCFEDTFQCAHKSHSRRLFFQSKALEILCHTIESLRTEGTIANNITGVTYRSLLHAKEQLAKSFASPPSLDELAHQVGLSRSRLCNGFRTVFGKTVYDYIHELRMGRAVELLYDGKNSISEIAYNVGYNHVSSFSTAVHKRFGCGPRDLRRNGRIN